MDPLLVYLVVINVFSFVTFTVDFHLWMRVGRNLGNGGVLSLFAVFGGGAGMLAAFLVWDRKVVKDNVAWRLVAVLGIVLWTLILLVVYGIVDLDVSAIIAPLDVTMLAPLGIYLAVINVATLVAFIVDKQRAKRREMRLREFTLLGMSLLGGAIGGIIAMRLAHHKTRVWYFRYGLPAMVVVQAALIAYARGVGLL